MSNFIKKSKFYLYIKTFVYKKRWRKKNSHNYTTIANLFNQDLVQVGQWTYGELNVKHYGANNERLKIGNYCSIAEKTTFLLGGNHNYKIMSTYPMIAKILNEGYESLSNGKILVDDDVWIGYGATILSGVHIGQGAVVAAGSVVSKDIPPYAVVGGVPAKLIKYRFEPEMIEELLKIDYSKLTKEQIEKHINELYVELKDKRQLDWMPKR